MRYRTRYVHKISPSEKDEGPSVVLTEKDTATRTSLAAALRRQKVLSAGERLNQSRVESSGKVVAFPAKSIWHSIIMTPMSHSEVASVVKRKRVRVTSVIKRPRFVSEHAAKRSPKRKYDKNRSSRGSYCSVCRGPHQYKHGKA